MDKKFKLTNKIKTVNVITLHRIQALKDFDDVKQGDFGGWIEKEENLSQQDNAWVYGSAHVSHKAWVDGNAYVSGNAWVYDKAHIYGSAWVSGDARVSGNARITARKKYTKGWFIGGDDSGKITDITEKTGSTNLKAQYVLGDYDIQNFEDAEKPKQTIQIGSDTYEVTSEFLESLKNLKKI